MKRSERRLFLNRSLLKEKTEYRDMHIPASCNRACLEAAAQIDMETVSRFMNRKTGEKKEIYNVIKDMDKESYARLRVAN